MSNSNSVYQILIQLTEALKFEMNHDCPLVRYGFVTLASQQPSAPLTQPQIFD